MDGEIVVKVVHVDDSIAIQRSFGRLLASVAGIEVVGHAEDVVGAIAVIDCMLPDAVVLDLDLREGGRGMDVLRHVVHKHPAIKVVVLSVFTWGAMRDVYLAAGASAYFDKSAEFLDARDWIAALVPASGRGDARPAD